MKTTKPIKKSEQTRQTIIEKTAPLFNRKGFAGTTLSDLEQATGLTKGSIYGNFENKDAVAIAVFKYNSANLMRVLSNSIESQSTFIEKLLAIPKAYRDLFDKMIQFGGCPIANTATEADDSHLELAKLAAEMVGKLRQFVFELIEKGKQSGEIQHLIDSGKTADIIISLIEGGSVLSKATGEKHYLMHSLDQVEYVVYSARLNETAS